MPCCVVPADLFPGRHGACREGQRGGTADEGEAGQHGKSSLAGVLGRQGCIGLGTQADRGLGSHLWHVCWGLRDVEGGRSSLAGVLEGQGCRAAVYRFTNPPEGG